MESAAAIQRFMRPLRLPRPLRCLEPVTRPVIGAQVCRWARLASLPQALELFPDGSRAKAFYHRWQRVSVALQGAHSAAKQRAAPQNALAMVAALAVDARGGGRLPDGLAYNLYEESPMPQWGGGLALERLKTGGGFDRAPRAPCANGELSALGVANAWAGSKREPGAEPAATLASAAETANRDCAAAGEPAGVPVFVMLPLDTVSAPAAQVLPLTAHGHERRAAFCHSGWCTACPCNPCSCAPAAGWSSALRLMCP